MRLTTQFGSARASGTLLPSSHSTPSASRTFVITSLITCVRTSTFHPNFSTVSKIIDLPRWHLVSRAYPPWAQRELIPVHAPCGIGSELWKTCVTAGKNGPKDPSSGGIGKWSRSAARRSPGDSNATAGRPNVMPRRAAKAPPDIYELDRGIS